MNAKARILVTGASGFVGAAVCEALLARGVEVVAAVRRADGAPAGTQAVVVGELDANTDFRAGLEGVNAVVHLAAHTHRGEADGERAAYQRVNVDATAALAAQAADAGVARFVFASSIKVNGERSVRETTGEWHRHAGDALPRPEGPYGESKLAAERLLGAHAARGAFELLVLRPPLVYGPGNKANLALLMRGILLGLPWPLGAIDNLRSLVYRDNLAHALVLAALKTGPCTGTYTIADCEFSTADLVRALALAMGRRAWVLPCPDALFRFACLAVRRPGIYQRLAGSLVVDSSAVRTALGWAPVVATEEALARTAAWYLGTRR
jgi:UDP-glucose 4-epimerase